MVGGDDFTVRGGAADAAIRGKQVMSEQMANELRVPLVRLVDGTGGGGSVKTIETMGYTYVPANPAWDWVVANMGTVPVVALGLGSVAGLGAARLVSSESLPPSVRPAMPTLGPVASGKVTPTSQSSSLNSSIFKPAPTWASPWSRSTRTISMSFTSISTPSLIRDE